MRHPRRGAIETSDPSAAKSGRLLVEADPDGSGPDGNEGHDHLRPVRLDLGAVPRGRSGATSSRAIALAAATSSSLLGKKTPGDMIG